MMILVNFMNRLNGLGLKSLDANPKETYYSTLIECELLHQAVFFFINQ